MKSTFSRGLSIGLGLFCCLFAVLALSRGVPAPPAATIASTHRAAIAKLGDWGLVSDTAGAKLTVIVFDSTGAQVGTSTITVGTSAAAVSACTWYGGWNANYYGAKVTAISGGNVYAAQTSVGLTTGNGDPVIIGYSLGVNGALPASITGSTGFTTISAFGTPSAQSVSVSTALTPGATSRAAGTWLCNTGSTDAIVQLSNGGAEVFALPAGTDRQIPYTGTLYIAPYTAAQTITVTSMQYAY